MGSSSRDTFQLWIIAKERGIVKRFECSIRKTVASVVVSCSVVLVALTVVADYSRLAWQRVSDGRLMQTVLEQNERLVSRNRTLRSEHREASNKLDRLEEVTSDALSTHRSVKEQLEQLSTIVASARELGLVDSPDSQVVAHRGGIKGIGGEKGTDPLSKERGSPLDAIAQMLQDKSRTTKEKAANKVKVATHSSGTALSKTSLAMGGAEFPCGTSRAHCAHGKSNAMSKMHQASEIAADVDEQEAAIESLRGQVAVLRTLPLAMPSTGDITSLFGVRESPFGAGERMHEGLDIACPKGTAVTSTGDGRVVRIRRDPTYGRVIDIAHSELLVTRYAHLSAIKVKVGDVVTRGQVVALSGSSGQSTGPHLHYEVRVHNRAVDPLRFIQLAKNLRELVNQDTATARDGAASSKDQWEAFG